MSIAIKKSGELNQESAFSILFEAGIDQEEGVFVFARPKEKISVILHNGFLKIPLSMISEMQWGQALLEKGVLNNATFMKIKALEAQQKIPFFQAAIQSSLVSFDQMLMYVFEKQNETFQKLFSWTQGKFIHASDIPKDIAPLDLDRTFMNLLFQFRKHYHVNNNTPTPNNNVALVTDSKRLQEMDMITWTPQELADLDVFKKGKNLVSYIKSNASKGHSRLALCLTCMDFGWLEKAQVKQESLRKENNFRQFNFSKIYKDHELLNHYELLSLSMQATLQDIKGQYLEIAKVYHPDRVELSGDMTREGVEKAFAQIAQAHRTLSSAESRKIYDESLVDNQTQEGDVEAKQVLESENAFLDGMASLRKGRYDQAVDFFQKAISLYSGEKEYELRLGWATYLYGKKEQNQKKILDGRNIIFKNFPKMRLMDQVYYYRGIISKNEGQLSSAIDFFQKAIQSNSDMIEAQQELRAVEMLMDKKSAKKSWFS